MSNDYKAGADAQRPRGRPRDIGKRAAIIATARQLFFDHGLETVRVDDVAANAGVSKMTVYKNFPDKLALFEAVVSAENDRIEAAIDDLQFASGQIDETLMAFGTTLLSFLFAPEIVRIDRVLGAEMSRHPQLGQKFFKAGPERMWLALAAIINGASERGELVPCDSKRAAENLIALWLGMQPMRHRFDDQTSGEPVAIPERIASGIAMFMATYRIPA